MTRNHPELRGPQYRPATTGFTVVELMVSIGIVGLLLALTLPAIQQVRESARRVECSSHLKQIMVAQHNYHDAYGAFCGRSVGFSWPGRLDRFLGVEFNERPAIYRCPSDPEAQGRYNWEISYLSSSGTGIVRVEGVRQAGDGFEPYTRWNSTRDFTDGLSNTAAVAEKLPVPQTVSEYDPQDHPEYWNRRIRYTPFISSDMQAFVNGCRSGQWRPPPFSYFTPLSYTHVMPPNGNSCSNGPNIAGLGSVPYASTASSMHSGGVYVALADGSVRFIADPIDLTVWWALGTRAGGETVSIHF